MKDDNNPETGTTVRSVLSKLFKKSESEMETTTPTLEKTFELPELAYPYDALEPHIDRMTMEIHHGKHHRGYVDNLNKALEDLENVPSSLEGILNNISKYPLAVRNNAGGHYNHSMYWKLMKFNGGGEPQGKLAEAIIDSFGSLDDFKTKFNEAALKHFGSGWAWLVVQNGRLEIGTTPNQDNPLMDVSEFKGTPILGIDVWEHAYYLKHQNKRVEYISDWWKVINWKEVENNYDRAD